MPTYTFRNKKTGEVENHFVHMSDLDNFKKRNPHLVQEITAVNVIHVYNPTKNLSGDFKDRLNEIKNSHLHSTVKTY